MSQLPEGLPELPPSMEMLSDLQSGTMRVVHLDAVQQYGQSCYLAGLERASLICDKQLGYYEEQANLALSAGRDERWERFRAMAGTAEYLAAAIRAESRNDEAPEPKPGD